MSHRWNAIPNSPLSAFTIHLSLLRNVHSWPPLVTRTPSQVSYSPESVISTLIRKRTSWSSMPVRHSSLFLSGYMFCREYTLERTKKLTRDMLLGPIETPLSTVEEAFQEFTKRKDIAIILINQHVRRTIDSTKSVLLGCFSILTKCESHLYSK